ncbi:MAG: amino acid adenylation domain-containing protein [Thermoanaerobaculia bacterium]
MSEQQQIEAYYPLSPLQQGLLFRCLFAPDSRAYFQQLTCTLAGPLDETAFERSWQRLVERHAVLRTAFAWEGLEEPLQVVGRKVRLPFRWEDWRELPPREREQRWRELCEADREQGFKPSRAPLMRITLLRVADEEWRLIWSFHHLLVDGWSNSILLREVFALYNALTRGEEPALPAPRPYREYVAWLQRQSLASAEAYWRRRLEGTGAPPSLPVEAHPHSGEPDDKDFAERHGRQSLRRSEELRGFARRHRLTINTLVQGAWALLLARYGGSTEAVFGVTLAGRPSALPGADSMVGVFVNTLPARVAVPADLAVVRWLAGVQMDQAELSQFEHTPLARVQAWSSLPVIFDKLLVFENYPLEVNVRAMRSVAVREVDHREYTQYPLALVAVPASELWLQIKYDGSRFDEPTVLRMLEHLGAVLSGLAVAGPEQRVGDLSLLIPGERQQVLVEWNDVPTGLNPARCLHQLFEEQAALAPDRPAVTFEGRSLTYGELDELANRLAGRLRAAGVGPEVRVGLCMERSLEMMVALLGTLKAGGAYVPLDPVHPRERLEAILENAAPAVLLVQPHLRGLLPAQGCAVLEPQADPPDPAAPRTTPVSSGVQPDHLAYIIFTSGSTGRPKGVMVPHRAIVNRVLWMHEVMTLQADDVIVQKTPFSFDASIWELFLPWTTGLRLVVAAPDGHRDTAYLADLIAREQVTILQLVPSMLQVFLEEPRLREVRSLRRVFCGGEALTPHLQERFFARVAGSDLHNLYGPTEAAIDATHWPCRRDAVRPVVVIGRPIANDRVHLADSGFQLTPVGVPGELLIGGVGLARGYTGRPDLTADKFVPDPFGEQPGQRLYRTGDLARRLPDGAIEFLGRTDHQVKIRGVRIELSEVESALLRHPSVREAMAVVLADDGGDKRLVAYAVPAGSADLDEAEVRSDLGRRLPEAMVPSRVVQLSRMPLLPNGKIDRKALPTPESPAASEREGAALRSPVQEIVAMVWSEVLGRPVTAARDDFFELGGHSLLAIRVVSRLRQAFQIDFPVRALFEHPTVAELADEIEGLLRSATQAPPPLRPAGRGDDPPLSYAQQRLWLLEQMQPGAGAYHLPLAVRFSGPLDHRVLERSLAEVARRHEVLRTCFPSEGGTPRQVVQPLAPPALFRIDLLAVLAGRREALLPALLQDLGRRPFDLARGPLLRVALIAMGPEDHVLSVTLHHIVSDGWSMSLLLDELAILYRAFSLGERSPLPELAVQYSDFARWERSWLQGAALDTRIGYWTEALAGAPARVELPTDFPRPERAALRGAARSRRIGEDLSARLRKLGRRAGATLFMVLLEAFEAVLSRWTGQDDLVLGTVIANRMRAEIEPLIGCFMNFLPLRLRSRADESGLELLARVRSAVLDAYSHQDCPFEKLVQAVNPDRRSGSNPLFNVGFLLQTQPRPAAGEGLTAAFVPVDLRSSLLDLRLVAWESAGGLQISLEYRTDLFAGETAELLLDAYEQALAWLAEGPERALSGMPLPERLERQAAAARDRERRPEIAIAATFTAEPLERPLRFWMEELGFDTEIVFAPYGQVFQELLGAGSLARNADGLNVILVRFEDWGRGRPFAADDLRRNVLDLAGALRSAASRSKVPFLVLVCPGSPANLAEPGAADLAREAADLLTAELAAAGGVHLVTSAGLAAVYPVLGYYDPHGDELGRIPYTPAFFNALATMVARRFFALRIPPYKVIAVDCDGTLWKGICAEDGPQGVELDTPRRALQELLVAQHEAGMLICVCSKNNERDVLDVFDTRADMPLRRQHVVGWRANWRPKSENLAALAAELRLGLDAFIFIDDNPVECAEVQAACPEVLVVALPADPAEIPALLRNVWAFDRLPVTDEDRSRTELYRQNEERENLRANSHSFREFLKDLRINVDVSFLQPQHVRRVAQLSHRTNQFNLTTIRHSENEIEEIIRSPERHCLVVSVQDRFGDYGLTGVVIYGASPAALEVETLLLSCRVLGRGVEHRVLEELGRIAAARGLSRVDLAFVPTARNQPARDFLASFGEEPGETVDDGFAYRLPVRLLEGLTRRFLEGESTAEESGAPGLLAPPRMARPGVSGEAPQC